MLQEKSGSYAELFYTARVQAKKYVRETDLASLARQFRTAAGKNRAQAARELGVARQAIIYAEDHPEKSFLKLRCRIIEMYSSFDVSGPMFLLSGKK